MFYYVTATDANGNESEPSEGVYLSQMSLSIAYIQSWNLVGLPLEVEDAFYNYLFPESIDGTLYSFNDGYNSESALIAGEGYWLRFVNFGSVTITGSSINELTLSLSAGWNLIFGITQPVNESDIQDPNGIIITGTLYSFTSEGYTNSEILGPGIGYWIRANNSGTILLISN